MTASNGSIRVTSWNIHGCVGADRRCDSGRILAAIARIDPDVLALQEVDGRAQFGREEQAFERFAASLGANLVEARTVLRPRRDYGHLLWSRWPIERSRLRRLPGGRFEPRMAIDAVLRVPGGFLRVLSSHFGLIGRDRRRQAEALAAFALEESCPTLVLGDFNEWRSSGPVEKAIGAVLPVRLAPRTWPASRPIARMDRFYASRDIELEPVAGDAASRTHSDHLAVTAELRISSIEAT
jgi:endonuclease/exonuclease/phosphatase family metal-dependent hydrolase